MSAITIIHRSLGVLVSPRRRNSRKRGWPEHLYERDGYYSYRSPIDGVEYGLGRDRAKAFAQAVEANLKVSQIGVEPRLIDRITGDATRTVEAWNTKYTAILDATGKYAAVTLRQYRSFGKRMVQLLGPQMLLARVNALKIQEVLETTAVTEGKARTAQALRNFMRDSFREARVQGWYTAENPVMDSKLSVKVTVQRSRLSFETFMQAYERAKLIWLKNAMALALVSGQRREDIALAKFADFRDGGWYCEQQSEKSADPHRIFIPAELRLKVFGMSLGDVVSQCRHSGVLSKFLIHQTVNRGNSPAGRPIFVDTISKRFADVIGSLGLDWGDKDPPTFHEIRSLSERLYSDQGGVNTQELLGHNDPETTAGYHDPRGSEWVRIKVTV